MEPGVEDGLLSFQNFIRQKLRLYVFKAKTINGSSEALAGIALLTE